MNQTSTDPFLCTNNISLKELASYLNMDEDSILHVMKQNNHLFNNDLFTETQTSADSTNPSEIRRKDKVLEVLDRILKSFAFKVIPCTSEEDELESPK